MYLAIFSCDGKKSLPLKLKTTTTTFIMTRIFTILQKYININLKKFDNSNSANP